MGHRRVVIFNEKSSRFGVMKFSPFLMEPWVRPRFRVGRVEADVGWVGWLVEKNKGGKLGRFGRD